MIVDLFVQSQEATGKPTIRPIRSRVGCGRTRFHHNRVQRDAVRLVADGIDRIDRGSWRSRTAQQDNTGEPPDTPQPDIGSLAFSRLDRPDCTYLPGLNSPR